MSGQPLTKVEGFVILGTVEVVSRAEPEAMDQFSTLSHRLVSEGRQWSWLPTSFGAR